MQGRVDTAATAEVLMGLTAHSLLSRFLCILPTVESLGFLKNGLHCPETSEISVAPPPLSSSRTLCFPFLSVHVPQMLSSLRANTTLSSLGPCSHVVRA